MGLVLSTQETWNAGTRLVDGLSFDQAGLCPAGRGVLETLNGETWLNMTCAESDPVTGSSKRTEFAFGTSGDPRLVGNRFYAAENYFKDYAPDALLNPPTAPNSCNHLFFQWKYGSDHPQLAMWAINSGGVMKYELHRKVSPTIGATPVETTHIIGNLQSNQKVKWAFDVLWKGDNTGYVKIYINGVKVFELTGIQTVDAQANPSTPLNPPFRCGPYCFGGFNNIKSRTIYYRDVKVGTSEMSINDFLQFRVNTNRIRGRKVKNK